MRQKIKFTVQAVPDKNEKSILMRVFLEDGVVSMSTGYSVPSDFWVRDTYRVKWNCINKKRESARVINSGLDKFQEIAEKTEAYFSEMGMTPSVAMWKHQFQVFQGKVTRECVCVADLFSQFESEKGIERAWSNINYVRNDTVISTILKFKPNVKPKDFSKEWLLSYHAHLIQKGLSNSTIKKHLTFTKAFIKWLSEKRIIDDQTFRLYRPKIKDVKNKTIIFLDEDELKRMIQMKIPETSAYLDRVRDVFIFGCFTGMRFSDIKSLRKKDIYKGKIHFTAGKTDKVTEVELNEMSKRILEKYEDDGSIFALPVPLNQNINRWIKDVALMAGIDQEVVVEHYVGAEKITKVKPKWQLITFHASRRTFCSQAVMNGISVETIMKWTGHASIREMKPYLELASKFKEEEMKKMNFLSI